MKRRRSSLVIAAISIITTMVTGCGAQGNVTPSVTNPQNTEKAITVENIKDAKVGDIIKFGSYEQDNDLSNGNEPIEWIVFSKGDWTLGLLSKYALDRKFYNETFTDITWENCTLRSWLNNDFYNTAFSDSEKQRIVTFSCTNPDSYELYNVSGLTLGAKGGNKTNDNVFLLSWDLAKSFFDLKVDPNELKIGKPNQNLFCEPTAYTKAQGGVRGNYCEWWLQSPGVNQTEASLVNENGELATGKVDACFGVRPVILVDYSKS